MDHLRLCLALLGLLACGFGKSCSVENISCDSGGKALLNTTDFYTQYNNCNWSLRNKSGTNIKSVTPSPNITVQCTVPEVDLKVHCSIPKLLQNQACYKLEHNAENQAPSRAGATHHHISMAAKCLWCWMFFISYIIP